MLSVQLLSVVILNDFMMSVTFYIVMLSVNLLGAFQLSVMAPVKVNVVPKKRFKKFCKNAKKLSFLFRQFYKWRINVKPLVILESSLRIFFYLTNGFIMKDI